MTPEAKQRIKDLLAAYLLGGWRYALNADMAEQMAEGLVTRVPEYLEMLESLKTRSE